MAATGYFSHPSFRLHEMGRGHPECPQRLDAIADRLLVTGLLDALDARQAPAATLAHLSRGHSAAHMARLADAHATVVDASSLGDPARVALDPDTSMNAQTLNAAQHAAGAAVAAVDAVMAGQLSNAFCAVRPPGHHATRDQAMGFCFYNNAALAALHAIHAHGLKRVAVVDFDVHHGNGTEDILKAEPRALMVGFFQHPFYPYSGQSPSAGNISNTPVAAYTRGMDIREIFEQHCMPRLMAFKPEFIVISAGFDAHREDDIGQLGMTEADYQWMTRRIMDAARAHSKGRIVSCLEGGYNLSALGRSVEVHVRALAEL
jgi:acetoin utilization deacetylase AcuC-like enzyme